MISILRRISSKIMHILALPHEVTELRRYSIRAHHQTTIATSKILNKNRRYRVIPLNVEHDAYMTNPGLVYFQEKLLVIARICNLMIRADRHGSFDGPVYRARILQMEMDNQFARSSTGYLDDTDICNRIAEARHGIEDVRPFVWQGELYGIGAGYSLRPDGTVLNTQILVKFDADTVRHVETFQSPAAPGQTEKNWIPLVYNDELLLVYQVYPTIIYRYTQPGLELLPRHPADQAHSSKEILRGSSNFIEYDGHYIAVAHYPPMWVYEKRYYQHVFIAFDRDLRLIDISEPFFFFRPGIEFVLSLLRDGDTLLISVGSGDRYGSVLVMPIADLHSHLLLRAPS